METPAEMPLREGGSLSSGEADSWSSEVSHAPNPVAAGECLPIRECLPPFANAKPIRERKKAILMVPTAFKMPFCVCEWRTHSRMNHAFANASTHIRWFC
jgi:hypothetical protein